MAEKIIQIIRSCIYGILALVVNIIAIPVILFHLIIKIRRNEVSVYTNVRVDGKKLGSLDLAKKFALNMEPMNIQTDQGNVMLIHGQPSNLFPFVSKAGVFTNEGMAKLVPVGKYILISCHNGFHKDFEYDGRSFTRDRNTISMYPSVTTINPFNGSMYVYADEFCLKVQVLQNPILWGKYDIHKMNLVHDWEMKDKEYTYDELPDEIKRIVDKQREVA